MWSTVSAPGSPHNQQMSDSSSTARRIRAHGRPVRPCDLTGFPITDLGKQCAVVGRQYPQRTSDRTECQTFGPCPPVARSMSLSVILRPCACRSTSCNGGRSRPQVRAMSEHQRHNRDPCVRGGTNRFTRRHDWHHGSFWFSNAAVAWSVRLSRHWPAGGRHVRTNARARIKAAAACANATSSSSCACRTGSAAAPPVASSPVGSDTSLRRPGPAPPVG